jgi:hypothetical protein
MDVPIHSTGELSVPERPRACQPAEAWFIPRPMTAAISICQRFPPGTSSLTRCLKCRRKPVHRSTSFSESASEMSGIVARDGVAVVWQPRAQPCPAPLGALRTSVDGHALDAFNVSCEFSQHFVETLAPTFHVFSRGASESQTCLVCLLESGPVLFRQQIASNVWSRRLPSTYRSPERRPLFSASNAATSYMLAPMSFRPSNTSRRQRSVTWPTGASTVRPAQRAGCARRSARDPGRSPPHGA